jgi:hypothetical protein
VDFIEVVNFNDANAVASHNWRYFDSNVFIP